MNLNDLITHPDKVFWPDESYTKLDLATYYDAVFAKLQPYLDDRLLSLDRFPALQEVIEACEALL